MALKSKPISVYNPNDYLCGIGNWRPQRLQWFASPRVFLVMFSAISIIQGANFTYMIASITTLEKRYSFDSKISGLLLTADNVMELIANPLFGYLATRLHRPRFIGFSIITVVFSCYLAAVPYFIYGHKEVLHSKNKYSNNSSYEFCDPNRTDTDEHNNCESNTVIPAVIILWISSALNGIGFTAFYIVGVPFLDDNIKKKNSPIYISTVAALRFLGPTLAFMLSSFFLRFYENPFVDSGIKDIKDPQWIGAWWLGFVVLGTAMLFINIPIFFFPKYLKSPVNVNPNKMERVAEKEESIAKRNSNKFIPSFKRLLKNPIWICQTIGNTTRLFGLLGYMIFKPKYMESQFGKSASSANFFSGAVGVIPNSVGLFIGGILISVFRPKPRILVTSVMLLELFGHFSFLGAMFITCPQPITSGTQQNEMLQMKSSCNSNCKCTLKSYKPVCASDGITNYFSPCFANCNNVTLFSNAGQPEEFSNCECFEGIAKAGNCAQECNKFPIFISIFFFSSLLGSISFIGNTIINLRIIDKKDKSMAFGISGFIMNLFAFIPYPLVFGAVIDSACKVWETGACGQQGNCWIYDTEKFRYYLHGMALVFMAIGTMFDIIVIFLSGRIKDMYDDNIEHNENTDTNNAELHSLASN